jgi:hypothetical protein
MATAAGGMGSTVWKALVQSAASVRSALWKHPFVAGAPFTAMWSVTGALYVTWVSPSYRQWIRGELSTTSYYQELFRTQTTQRHEIALQFLSNNQSAVMASAMFWPAVLLWDVGGLAAFEVDNFYQYVIASLVRPAVSREMDAMFGKADSSARDANGGTTQ